MSRFAKLVNAQASREQEKPRASTEHTSVTNEATSESPRDTKATPVITPVATPVKNPAPAPVTTGAITPVTTGAITPVETESRENQRESLRTSPQYLDATHTASEQRVFSIMYRETISRGVKERHFGPKELCEKTGIRSDRTIRTALDGLIEKLSIEIVSNFNGSPLGPRYRIFEPKEIAGRRKVAGIEIDPQSKKITTPAITPVATPVQTGVATGDKNYRGTGVVTTGVTGVEIAGASYKYRNTIGEGIESAAGSSSNLTSGTDDEAYAQMVLRFRQAVEDVTGRSSAPAEAERWVELAELLIMELKIAAGRTGSISSVPAFLTEHLRRRLWKKEKRQIEAEAAEQKTSTPAGKMDALKCPDCFGTGMYYPKGFDKGVAKCFHSKLTAEGEG